MFLRVVLIVLLASIMAVTGIREPDPHNLTVFMNTCRPGETYLSKPGDIACAAWVCETDRKGAFGTGCREYDCIGTEYERKGDPSKGYPDCCSTCVN